VGRNRGRWWMTWQTRVGVVDVAGGWRREEHRWGIIKGGGA